MNNRQADVIVIGAGIMGASAAWHLARRGQSVAVFEQFDLDHVRGSSHGASRIFRLAYDQVDYVRLAQQALPLWREAERELGSDLLWNTGLLDLGPRDRLNPFAHALAAAEVNFEFLSGAALRRRFPAFRLPEEWEALYHPDGGVIYADAARRGLLQLAIRAGAAVNARTKATRLLPLSDGVSIETTDGTWHAGSVVVTTASWSNRLLKPLDLAVPLKVTREHVAYYRFREPETVTPFICHDGDPSFEFYGLPNGRGDEVKVGGHKSGREVDPDTEGVVDQARLKPVKRLVRERLPSLEAEPFAAETCLYASTPDDDFVIDRIGPVILGVGFGGHGFKFGAVIGKLLAGLVEGAPIPFSDRFTHRRLGLVTVSS